jgi:hypothetical protein
LDANGGRIKSVAYPARQRVSRQQRYRNHEADRFWVGTLPRAGTNAHRLHLRFVTGADGFRLPLRLTSDKRVVVFEDERPIGSRAAGAVSDLTLDQLRALDIGANFTEPDGSPL